MPRYPALDGLRGVAISLVLLCHLWQFQQGWVGVDIFFVLSGYLITKILLTERESSHYWRKFWLRRATRIVPPYLVTVGAAWVVFGIPRVLWPYLLLPGANIAHTIHKDEFIRTALNPLWSLSVEEHYYLLWPLLVRLLRRRSLIAISALQIILEQILRIAGILHGYQPKGAIYFLTPFRLDGLAWGSLLALLIASPTMNAWIKDNCGWPFAGTVCAFMACGPWLLVERFPLFCAAIGYSLVAVCSAACVAYLVTRKDTFVSRMLTWGPLVWLGRISYGVYLYHYIFRNMAFHRAARLHFGHQWLVSFPVVIATLFVAWLSFKYFETPIMAWGKCKIQRYDEEPAALAAAA